ncbi:hypothetical protein I5M32_15940 [Pedobacter sp. SD-b]|uniref:Uncharacterized protein n=1 Tax=Pedobacter segetis TaxID=2793069 RepID=A0ABS1BNI7_9SPHI|nr:hypothetical protein [Pedobacter segetis]MBK0384457.1 hypothetical protein [Pedobacter segetis]
MKKHIKKILLLGMFILGLTIMGNSVYADDWGDEEDECYGDQGCDEGWNNCYGNFNYQAGLALGQFNILDESCFDLVGPTMENAAKAYLDSQSLPSSPPRDDFWEFIASLIDQNATNAADYYQCINTANEVYGDMLDQAADDWQDCLNSYN